MTTTTMTPTSRANIQAAPSALPALLALVAGAVLYDAAAWYLAVTHLDWQLYAVAGAGLAGVVAFAVSAGLAWRGRSEVGIAVALGAFWGLLLLVAGLAANQGVLLALMSPVLGAALAAKLPDRRRLWAAMLAASLVSIGCILIDVAAGLGVVARVASTELGWATTAAVALLCGLYALTLLRALADLSLRAKLVIAFLAVSLLPLGALAALNERNSRQALTDATNESLRGAAAQTALSLDTFFDNTRGIIQSEAQHPIVREFMQLPPDQRRGSPQLRELRATLALWLLRDTRAHSYMLLDMAGTVVQSTVSLDVGLEKGDQAYFREATASGQTYISGIQFERNAEQGGIFISMLIRDPETTRPLGVLVARYTARVVQDILEKTNGLAGEGSFGVVMDDNQMLIAHGLDNTVDFKLVGSSTPEQIAALQAAGRIPNRSTFVNTLGLDGLEQQLLRTGARPYFVTDAATGAAGGQASQAAVVPLNTFAWRVAFFQPQAVFLAPVERQTQATLTLAAVIALIVTGLAVGAAQVLADPIVRLTATADRVAGGDLTVQAEVASQDEIGLLGRSFNAMTQRLNDMVSTLEQRVAERTGQLQAAADISHATALVRNLDDLLRLALELIRERFGFYHASIFLLDAQRQYAVLRESTGPVGAQLKARGHKLAVGSQSLIGWVTANRKPRVASDVAEDPFHFKNPLLPDTRAELAIPLVLGDRLVGALDVQSREANAFGPGDIQVLQTLADQLSVAIENAELFQQTQTSLEEMSNLYQRMAGTSWRTLMQSGQHESVYEQAGAVTAEAGEALTIPLTLRDRSLGAIEIYGRPPDQWTAEERTALNSVAAQVAAALESAALLEETQRRRVREQVINEITYQMRATMNPTAVVQSGMRELGRALGATEVVVRLANDPKPPATPAERGQASAPKAEPEAGHA